MLFGHGDMSYLLHGDIFADFSTNVWYGGEPAGLKEHLFREWSRINRYPEVLGESLAIKTAHHHGLSPENILITNGATESMYLLAQAFSGQHSTIVIPSFSEYEDACRIHGHQLGFLPWEQLDSPGHPNLLWLGNPNNPTGSVYMQMASLLHDHPDTLFILDEAFIEFTRAISTAIPLLEQYPNLVILRSLTKAFAIPGLRLGYIAAATPLIKKLQSLKMPWSVNALALEAGHYIFDHAASLPLDQLLKDKDEFVQQLRQLPLHIHDSHTHYFLCETIQDDADALQQYLLTEHGLSIRKAGNFRGLGKQHFRLATLAPQQNQLLIKALKEWNPPCA